MILASTNKGKISEMRQILEPLGIDLYSAIDYPDLTDIKETGLTFKENALLKAKETFRITGQPSLADDSGLEVDALKGEPGIYSARYAGPESDDKKNVIKLLAELEPYQVFSERTARFRTVLAYVDQDNIYYFEGLCDGHIAKYPRGTSGFGYDPVFIPEGYKISFAEMNREEKNKISHRGKAVKAFREFIQAR
ncbi:MAG: RdgB/HAM1 family non-canonical purine NTP pyrophosphatase [Balneolales bacterium]